MSDSASKTRGQHKPLQAKVADASDERHREDTFMRLRSALLEDRLAVLELSGENTGTDPYNSGVHRAMAKGHVWNKRSR